MPIGQVTNPIGQLGSELDDPLLEQLDAVGLQGPEAVLGDQVAELPLASQVPEPAAPRLARAVDRIDEAIAGLRAYIGRLMLGAP
jgi:hypothetical protein